MTSSTISVENLKKIKFAVFEKWRFEYRAKSAPVQKILPIKRVINKIGYVRHSYNRSPLLLRPNSSTLGVIGVGFRGDYQGLMAVQV